MSLFCLAILLHRAKADLTLLDENRNTALHLACSKVRIIHTVKASLSNYSSSYIHSIFTPLSLNAKQLCSAAACALFFHCHFVFSSQAHEMCALLILGEIHSPTLINATNSALQM